MKISLVAVEPNGQPCIDCSIRQFSLCAALDKAELRELEHLGRHIHFASCETVFAQEEMTTSFYNLLEGVMRLYKLLPDGRRQIVGFALPGDFLGMAAFRAAQLLRRRDRTGYRLPVLQRFLCAVHRGQAASPAPNQRIGGSRTEPGPGPHGAAGTPFGGGKSRDLPDRLARSSGSANGATKTVALPMSRQDIADYLGLTIETVSRTFTKLERDGVIEILPGSVCLLDPARAEALAAA